MHLYKFNSMNPKTQKIALYTGLAILAALALGTALLLTGGRNSNRAAGFNAAKSQPDLPESAYPKEPVVVYQSDFSEDPGPEWDQITPTRHRVPSRKYYGDFYPNENPILTLDSLPPHRLIRATFNLIITDSWDGSCTKYGPSIFNLGLDDDRVLLSTTFCNLDFSDNMEQAFPDNYPSLPYHNFTLATERQNLGVSRTFGGGKRDCSSVYHLELTFPHAEKQIAFSFTTKIRDGSYKGYGIANMKVEALGQYLKLSEQEMQKMWEDLGSGIAQRFWKAKWSLIAAGDESVKYIQQHLNENIDLSDQDMQDLAKQIKSEDDPASWDALYQLRDQKPRALPLLQSARGSSGIYFLALAATQWKECPTWTSATEIRKWRLEAVLDAIHSTPALDLKGRIEKARMADQKRKL